MREDAGRGKAVEYGRSNCTEENQKRKEKRRKLEKEERKSTQPVPLQYCTALHLAACYYITCHHTQHTRDYSIAYQSTAQHTARTCLHLSTRSNTHS